MSFIRQKIFLRFTTILISTAGLSLVLGFFLFFKNINRIISSWGEIEKVTVYLDAEANETQIRKIKQEIQKIQDVQGVKLVSKEEAVEDFKAQVAGYIKDIKKDVNLMQIIPSYLEVSVSMESSFEQTIAKVSSLAKKIENLEFVEEVSFGSVWMEKYSKLIEYISSFAAFVGILLLTANFLVISNLIKTNLFQRSKEIEVLEMIGATKSYIRKPFLKEGVAMSLISAITSILIIFGLFYFLNLKFSAQVNFFKMGQLFKFLSFFELTVFVVISVAIGYLASLLNLIRFRWNSNK